MEQTEINIFLILANVVILVFIAGIIVFILQYRKRMLIHRRELLEKEFATRKDTLYQVSRDLHDDIGAGMSGINMLLQLAIAQTKNGQQQPASDSLQHIQGYTADVIEKISDLSFLLQPKAETMSIVFDRLKQYAETLCNAKGIQFHSASIEEMKLLQLDLLHRRNIFLVCKEAINNAIKYSKTSGLFFGIAMQDNRYTITIKDDGVGFMVSRSSSGNGIGNMQARCKEINVLFELSTELGKGTTVHIRIPS
ncbi:MAG: histidine kinase [Chitinophagaceae bacterium]